MLKLNSELHKEPVKLFAQGGGGGQVFVGGGAGATMGSEAGL